MSLYRETNRNYYYLHIQMDQLGTILEPFFLQIDWGNFAQILWIFEIPNSNLNETAFRLKTYLRLNNQILVEPFLQ